VVTEEGAPVSVAYGTTLYYVIDDAGFRRHVEAGMIDRACSVHRSSPRSRRGIAGDVRMMGQEDLFTKAMVDSGAAHIDLDQMLIMACRLRREWLGMMGFQW
jgi:hypothetical protein